MTDLRELYQEVILDHNKHPRNYSELKGHNCQAEGYNPLCGDHLYIYLHCADDRISDISFTGSGCAISKASASIMTTMLKGKTLEEARDIFRSFHKLITSDETQSDLEALGKLAVFSGVREFPVRVKCASLAWHTMKSDLEGDPTEVTTE